MSARRKRPVSVGAVLEVTLPSSAFAYLHLVGEHRTFGECVRVSAQTFDARPSGFTGVFDGGYVTYYPVSVALRQDLVEVVGALDVPQGFPPVRLRRPGAIFGGRVETWLLEGPSGMVVKRELSPEELQLPIGEIWNHEYLLKQISEGWRPEQEGADLLNNAVHEGGDASPEVPDGGAVRIEEGGLNREEASAAALRELAQHAESDEPAVFVHHLYFPRRRAAGAVAAALRRAGFEASHEESADGSAWLVLVRHRMFRTDEGMKAVMERLEQVASEGGGEYDGWEAEVPPA